MGLTECPCGEPLYEYQLACPQCGARNEAYVSFGWGRRIVVAVVGVASYQISNIVWSALSDREPVAELNLLIAVLVAGGVFCAFRALDALRLRSARRNVAAGSSRDRR